MYKKTKGNQIVTDNFKINELEFFLKKIWGKNSPLCHVEDTNKSQYCVIKNEDNTIIGCCGIKFIDKNTVELGSLAIDPKYRGQGLAKELYDWRESALKEYLDNGFQIITFATLGSNVMNFIIPKLKQLTTMPVYILNFTWGIVPIEKSNASDNILHKKLLFKNKGNYFTSTISVLATNNKSQFEEISLVKNLNIINYLPTTIMTEVKFNSKRNIYINLDSLRFVIWNIYDDKNKVFPKIEKNKFYQIKVPVLIKFQNIHKHFNKLSITGFSFEENILFINYSNITQNKLKTILKNIRQVSTDDSIKEWSKLILRINKKLHFIK